MAHFASGASDTHELRRVRVDQRLRLRRRRRLVVQPLPLVGGEGGQDGARVVVGPLVGQQVVGGEVLGKGGAARAQRLGEVAEGGARRRLGLAHGRGALGGGARAGGRRGGPAAGPGVAVRGRRRPRRVRRLHFRQTAHLPKTTALFSPRYDTTANGLKEIESLFSKPTTHLEQNLLRNSCLFL